MHNQTKNEMNWWIIQHRLKKLIFLSLYNPKALERNINKFLSLSPSHVYFRTWCITRQKMRWMGELFNTDSKKMIFLSLSNPKALGRFHLFVLHLFKSIFCPYLRKKIEIHVSYNHLKKHNSRKCNTYAFVQIFLFFPSSFFIILEL